MSQGSQLSRPTQIGPSNGKRVLCSQQALPVFNNLLSLAKSGNHWAGLVVRGIQGLNSGKLHKDNIFVEKKKSLAYGKGAFHIVLPGVTASLEELPNGTYVLQRIKADGNYQAMQQQSMRPGLWRVDADKRVEPTLQKDGKILNKEYRSVVIADMATDDAKKVATETRKDLVKINRTISSMVKKQGFDMHYTSGDGGIVGLKNAKKALATAKDTDIVQSATLLASTMNQARNIEGVLWYSDWGGSAVLTRAMEILLHEKNISLEKHSIFMNRPTTKANHAMELGKKLGLTPTAEDINAGLNYKEMVGNILVSDVGVSGTLKTTAFGVGATSTALTMAGGATAAAGVAGIVSVAGAMFFMGSAIKSGAKNFSGKKYT